MAEVLNNAWHLIRQVNPQTLADMTARDERASDTIALRVGKRFFLEAKKATGPHA